MGESLLGPRNRGPGIGSKESPSSMESVSERRCRRGARTFVFGGTRGGVVGEKLTLLKYSLPAGLDNGEEVDELRGAWTSVGVLGRGILGAGPFWGGGSNVVVHTIESRLPVMPMCALALQGQRRQGRRRSDRTHSTNGGQPEREKATAVG